MSDFETIFGAGADILDVIDGINASNKRESLAEAEPEYFSTFVEAKEWAKNNPGQSFTGNQESGYYPKRKPNPGPRKCFVWSIDPDAPEVESSNNFCNVGGYFDRMIKDGDSPTKIARYLTDVVSSGGVSMHAGMTSPQPPLAKIVASLAKAGFCLSPLSKEFCLIEELGQEPQNEAVLITLNGETTLSGYYKFWEIHSALMCENQ